jgi:predicted glycoside hydrolase/deacetylase ChbG (UPF0249 family)
MQPKYLIVNADDYGHTAGVSRGIREAHLTGIVTSTTAMLNMSGVEEALREAIATCPQLGLGVHLVLTAGAPVLPASLVPSLVGNDGRFFKQAEFRARLATCNPDDAQAEWRAQIEKFCAVVGRSPDHLDSHHHTSYWSPSLLAVMLALASEYHCPIRPIPSDNPDEAVFAGMSETEPRFRTPLGRELPALTAGSPGNSRPQGPPKLNFGGNCEKQTEQETLKTATRTVRGQLNCASPYFSPDQLITTFYDMDATLDHLLNILRGLKEGVTEIMTHPGYADDALLNASSYNRQRERELKILTDPAVKTALGESGVELTNFGRYARGGES